MTTEDLNLLKARPEPKFIEGEVEMDRLVRGDKVKTILGEGDEETPKWRVYDGLIEGRDTVLEQVMDRRIFSVSSERKYLQFGWENQSGIVCFSYLHRHLTLYSPADLEEYDIRKDMLVLADLWEEQRGGN